MLADAAFCELAYAIGVASLAASDAQIWHLSKLYWCGAASRACTPAGRLAAMRALQI
jgi:hypothetical protein